MSLRTGKSFVGALVTALWFSWFAAVAAVSSNELVPPADSGLSVRLFQVDGEMQDQSTNARVLNLSPGNHALSFHFGQADSGKPRLRLQYMLEGVDKKWREVGGEGMRVTVRFQNASEDIVGETSFKVLGNSPGWRGAITNSYFLHSHQKVTVPEGAVNMVLLLVSGGPIENVGAFAIDDLNVRVTDALTGHQKLWVSYDFEKGEDLDSPTGTPRDWVRGGLRRDILQIVRCGEFATNHVLAAMDSHIQSFGEWFCTVPLEGHAKPGDVLSLDWKQIYSVGVGGRHFCVYDVVPPGRYTFRVVGLSVPDEKEVASVALPIYVPVTFFQSVWFFALCVGIGSAVVGVGARHLTRRRMQLQMERLQWQQSLERERTRIARDIHDDIGSGLTRISMLSEAAREQLKRSVQPTDELAEITTTTRAIVGTLDEIVWAVNPSHDKLDSLVAYCGKYAQDFFKIIGIQCRLNLDFDVPDWTLTSQVRHNLFLAFKEILTNSARHAKATAVRVSFKMGVDCFTLTVQDNGQGFDPELVSMGNGLNNLRQRLNEIGGQCLVESSVGGGTTVKLIIKKQP